MRSPFPGMDPWLENPGTWHPFHTHVVVKLGEAINAVIPAPYYASVEERTYIVTSQDREEVQVPDILVTGRKLEPYVGAGKTSVLDVAGVEVIVPAPELLKQRYLQIRNADDRDQVVTAIEVLSPSNKRPGLGRDDYAEKRGRVLASRTNLIEIDLLRSGPRLGALGAPEGYDYSLLIARAATRPRAQLIPFAVRDPIPDLPVPLGSDDPELNIGLGAVVESVYTGGQYARRTNYALDPDPRLDAETEAWANRLLTESGFR